MAVLNSIPTTAASPQDAAISGSGVRIKEPPASAGQSLPVMYCLGTKSAHRGKGDVVQVLERIRDGFYRQEVEHYRGLLTAEGKTPAVQKVKEDLRGFVIGVFTRRSDADCLVLPRAISVDFDGVADAATVRDAVAQSQHCLGAFISPSANGVKAIFAVTPPDGLAGIEMRQAWHLAAYNQAVAAAAMYADVPVDAGAKALSQLIFVSFDPDCYINADAEPLPELAAEDYAPKPTPEPPRQQQKATTSNATPGDAPELSPEAEVYQRRLVLINALPADGDGPQSRNNRIAWRWAGLAAGISDADMEAREGQRSEYKPGRIEHSRKTANGRDALDGGQALRKAFNAYKKRQGSKERVNDDDCIYLVGTKRRGRKASKEPTGDVPPPGVAGSLAVGATPVGCAERLLRHAPDKLLVITDAHGNAKLRVDNGCGVWVDNAKELWALVTYANSIWVAAMEAAYEDADAAPVQAARSAAKRAATPNGFADIVKSAAVAYQLLEDKEEVPPELTVADEELVDADRRYLGCANGVVDLDTKELLTGAAARACLVASHAPWDYRPDARHELVDRLFEHLPAHMKRWIEQCTAYALRSGPNKRGYTWYGEGDDGKTTWTFAETIALGDVAKGGYVRPLSGETLAKSRWGGKGNATTEWNGIEKALIAYTNEMPSSMPLDTEALKKLMDGGANFNLRRQYQEEQASQPTKATLFICINDKSIGRVVMDERAFTNRMRILRLPSIPKADQDNRYWAKMKAAGAAFGEAMLAYLVDLANRYGEELPADIPEVVQEGQRREQESLGVAGDFIRTRLEYTGDPDHKLLWEDAWADFADSNGASPADKEIAGVTMKQLLRRASELNGANWPVAVRRVLAEGGPRRWVYPGWRLRPEEAVDYPTDPVWRDVSDRAGANSGTVTPPPAPGKQQSDLWDPSEMASGVRATEAEWQEFRERVDADGDGEPVPDYQDWQELSQRAGSSSGTVIPSEPVQEKAADAAEWMPTDADLHACETVEAVIEMREKVMAALLATTDALRVDDMRRVLGRLNGARSRLHNGKTAWQVEEV